MDEGDCDSDNNFNFEVKQIVMQNAKPRGHK